MRFVNVEAGGRSHLGILDGDHVFMLAALARLAARGKARAKRRAAPVDVQDDLVSFIERGTVAQARAALALGKRLLKEAKARDLALPVSKVHLLAPIPRPRKNIFCMGRNYAEHAKESGSSVPDGPDLLHQATDVRGRARGPGGPPCCDPTTRL